MSKGVSPQRRCLLLPLPFIGGKLVRISFILPGSMVE